MANVAYPQGLQALGQKLIDLTGEAVWVSLLDTNVVGYDTSHDTQSDIAAGVIGTPVALTGKSFTNGVFDADDATFTAVSGAQFEALVISAGPTLATSRLLVFIDTGTTGLPGTPTGEDIDLVWNNGSSKIFALVG